MDYTKIIQDAQEKFGKLLYDQLMRVERINAQKDFANYSEMDKITIGICGGDGIGPAITSQAERIMKYLLADDFNKGRIIFKDIDGLTIENRVKANKAIPDDVLSELK